MDKYTLLHATNDAKIIQKDYDLCDSCLGRLYAKKLHLSSNRLLGRKIHKKIAKKSKCYICKDLADNLEPFHSKILEKTKEYQFATFLIGAILKPSIIERDDLIRSKFKLRGIDGVKTDISRQLAKKLAQKTGLKIDHLKPDLTITVNLKDSSIATRSRSLVMAGRYTKSSRELSQKKKSCAKCRGKGCDACSLHGFADFESIEGRIFEFLRQKLSASQVKITWIGGEDKSSLVGGRGRPFFVQVINPKKRKIKIPKKIALDGVSIHGLRQVPSIPRSPIKFKSKMKLLVQTRDKMEPASLKKLGELKNSQIAVYENSKRITKSSYSVKYDRLGADSFALVLELDGGIPIKKLVDGEEVFPNLTDLLGTKCVCKGFDLLQVTVP